MLEFLVLNQIEGEVIRIIHYTEATI